MTGDDRTPGEIIADRLAELVDRARELPRDGVIVASRYGPIGKLTWARPGRTAITDPRHWPAELPPLPFTVGDALDVVEGAAEDIADDVIAELWRVVEALVPPELAGDVAEAVAADWPLADALDTARDRALDLLDGVRLPFGPRARRYFGREREIAEWAAGRLDARLPEYAAQLRQYAPTFGGLLTGWRDDAGRWPAEGLTLVWLAEALVRRRRFALDAWSYAVGELDPWATARVSPADAREILDGIGEISGCPDDVLDAAARELLLAARHLARGVRALPEPTDEREALALSRKAAELLATRLNDENGRDDAKQARDDAKQRASEVVSGENAGEAWLWWADRRWVERLALGLWRARWIRAVRAPALALPVARKVGELLLVTGIARGRSGVEVLTAPTEDERERAVAEVRLPAVTAVEGEALRALLDAGAKDELQTAIAPRLITYLIDSFQRRFDESAPLVWHGSGEESPFLILARELGLPAQSPYDLKIKRILQALALSWHTIGPYEGQLLTVEAVSGRGRGNRGFLKITPALPLQSSFSAKLSDKGHPSALAPLVVFPAYRPPLPGRPNDYASGHRLWLALTSELADKNVDIYKGYGAEVDLPALAAANRVPRPLIEAAAHLTKWTDPENPLIEVVGPGRYHLAPRFADARAVLEEGGRRRVANRKSGLKAAEWRKGGRGK